MKFNLLILFLFVANCLGQPSTNSATLATLDIDGNGVPEAVFAITSSMTDNLPETWEVDLGVTPKGASRILKAGKSRIQFLEGEEIALSNPAHTNVFPDPPRPPSYTYDLGMLSYRAIFGEDWNYIPRSGANFESEKSVILGFRFALTDGNHFGWMKFERGFADRSTPFSLKGFDYHPVPDHSIEAGKAPELPLVETFYSNDQVEFKWDARWGSLVLESSTNLASSSQWEAVAESTGGPISVVGEDAMRYFRLRRR